MKFNKKRVAIATFIALIFVSFFTISSIQDNQTNAAELSSTRSIDVETGATTLNRCDFNDNFTLSGTVGMRYQVGGAFNPTGPALTDEQTKARYDAETGIITLTPNRNDWSGNFTLNNRISTEQPFKLKGAIYLGDRTDADWRDTDVGENGGTPSGGADGIGFAFHPEEVGSVGFTGANMGIGGLKGAIGYKFDTYWNTPQQSNDDDNHRLGWEIDPENKGAHLGNPFGSFIETTTTPTAANSPLLNSGRTVTFSTEAGFAVGDWSQIAWLDTSKILQNSGVNRRIEIGDDNTGNPVQGSNRRETPDYGYDANELLSPSEKDNTTGFQNVIYDYQPDGAGKGILKIYLLHGVTTNPIGPNALTDSGINYDLIGQKQIESSDSLALAVSASTGAFRNLQQFRFDSFEYSAVKRLTIDKTWDDNNNANGIRHDTVEVQVWDNLKATSNKEEARLPYKTPIKITSTDNWHYVYDNLPKYNNEGREIFYDVTELPVAGYESTYQRMNDDEVSDIHIEISNKTQNPLNISGEKIWLDEGDTDSRPDHITIQLWRKDNNQERQVKFNELSAGYQSIYGQVNPNDFVTQETNSNKNWEYSFSYLSGTETVAGLEQGIQYFFKEELPGNYKYKYQTQVIGHDIVNTPIEVEKTSLIVSKVWEDTGYEKNRPESITVQLYADNIAQGKPTIISANENWTKEFNDLILRDAKGNEISYSVKELNVTEDYQLRQSQEDKKITLINKFVKEEVKPDEEDKQNNNKEKESSPNNEEIKKDNVEKETTNSLPIVGQHPEVWMILLGTGLLFIVLILIKYKSKNKKSSNKE
ncbi:Cna B-type domain-containing protein [Lactococcus cremoris]|uniref:Cna B-type domain-containing protein n=1 Tax=Lactococcus lactis subsp. cremoris TaxID=1359 RepID=UPI0021822C3C|nr:Cna B-type domain-containing protein [Lactococcus cremoris]MCT0451829.1 Cna B-type domain-containing protein [Lactococcus cremoris]